MIRSNLFIGLFVAIFTFGIWAYMNQPRQEPAWPKRIQGFSFSPMRVDDNPIVSKLPTEAEIEADLALLSGKTHAIRTYTVNDVQGKIPELARKHKINVALGGWVDADLEKTEKEIESLIQIANSNRNVVRVILGNETVLLTEELPIEKLIDYLDRARKAIRVPVSTAEPWHVWVKHPELADHVDYLAVHMLPYWEGIHVNDSTNFIVKCTNDLKEKFPGKPIVIAEVGWPSDGRTRNAAVSTVTNQATFLRRFLDRAEKEDYTYYVMEAFDQPWKRDTEGAVGAYWGVYDVYRKPKFPFSDPIVPIPQWHVLALISVVIATITLSLLLVDSQTLRHRGRSFLAFITFTTATAAVWIVYNYLHQYLTVGTVIVGILMFIGMNGVILVVLAEAHEWAEALWVKERRRAFKPVQLPDEQLPMVSIHLPTYNEPPEMLIETLDALSHLDYPRYEVLVIDNNTTDRAIWQPVEEHCAKLGPRFRFFHVSPLSGFKAGALNYALKHTCDDAEIIAAIDSDYLVDPSWLKDLVPQFANRDIALVQAPQDYRDEHQDAFKAMCFREYQAFFHIGMVTRNERDAIIQHGTMTLVRRSVLQKIGGWSEWCITEDAELGLRIFEHGYSSIYIPKSYGKGLMPDTYLDYKKQRHRWAYGAIQILRRHAGELLGLKQSQLSHGQRYHFLAGWLPWIADGINLLFNLGVLSWSLAMIIDPLHVDPPLVELSLLPMTLFFFKAVKMVYLYRTRLRTSIAQTVAAGLAGLALSHTIAKAVLLGMLTRNLPFFRTPKLIGKPALVQAVASAQQEGLVLVLLLGATIGVCLRATLVNLDLYMWVLVLLIQSIPYLAAVLVSIISGFSSMTVRFYESQPNDGRS